MENSTIIITISPITTTTSVTIASSSSVVNGDSVVVQLTLFKTVENKNFIIYHYFNDNTTYEWLFKHH